MSREASALCFPIDAHLLGGGGSTWLIDAQGGGYLARNGLMLTRFHEDCTLPSGPRLYLRENQSGGFRDLCTPSVSETIRFEAAQAVFTNEWLQIRTTLRMFVNPLDGAFLHHLTLENSEDTERSLEIASYLGTGPSVPCGAAKRLLPIRIFSFKPKNWEKRALPPAAVPKGKTMGRFFCGTICAPTCLWRRFISRQTDRPFWAGAAAFERRGRWKRLPLLSGTRWAV